MPEARLVVDVERLVRAHLVLDEDLLAELGASSAADAAVMTELDDTYDPTSSKVVQFFRASSTNRAGGHIERPVVQVNGHGPTKAAAWALWVMADLAMRRLPAGAHVGAVVTDVERLTGPEWDPDPPTDGPRYTSSYALTVHPAP